MERKSGTFACIEILKIIWLCYELWFIKRNSNNRRSDLFRGSTKTNKSEWFFCFLKPKIYVELRKFSAKILRDRLTWRKKWPKREKLISWEPLTAPHPMKFTLVMEFRMICIDLLADNERDFFDIKNWIYCK